MRNLSSMVARESSLHPVRVVGNLFRVMARFRYPVSLPEDIAKALGVEFSNAMPFDRFVDCLTNGRCRPTTLKRFMSRDRAEAAFASALRRERFRGNSLFSYYFKDGWLEFSLHFDDSSRLRRVYVHHRSLGERGEVEIPLKSLEEAALK